MKATHLALILLVFAAGVPSMAHTVYVESNEATANSLLSFSLDDKGVMTPHAAVATDGKGFVDASFALGPYDSDQQIIVNKSKTLMFAVNSGSNTISVFSISKSGALAAVSGSPFDSHGINPVSVGLFGNVLTVVNKHGDPLQASDASLPNYTNFAVNGKGQLTWIEGSTVEVANGSSPSQALTSPLGPYIFGADFLGGLVQSFQLTKMGKLARRSSLAIPAAEFPSSQTPRLPLGLAAHPAKAIVYVGLPTAGKIAVYSYGHYGELYFKGTALDSGAGVCWLVVSHDGQRLYASNTADPSVTVYDIKSNPLAPREIQKIKITSQGGAYQIALTPDESQLVVLTQRYQPTVPQGAGNEIHVLQINKSSGVLSEPKAPIVLQLPGDTRPQGIVIL